MSNIFGIFYTGVSGLWASQAGIDVTGHNITNVNTEGYSRQRVSLATSGSSSTIGGVTFGGGVDVTQVERVYDEVLSKSLSTEQTSLNYYQSMQMTMSKVEVYFNELEMGSGLGDGLRDYFDAWQDLSNSAPDNSDEATVKRYALMETATTLTQKMRDGYGAIETIRSDNDRNLREYISQVNDIAENIANLNGEIAKLEGAGDHANDLRDSRQLLVDQISKLINVNVYERDSGKISVFLGGNAIVDENVAHNLYAVGNDDNEGHVDIYWGEADKSTGSIDMTDQITGGKMFAELKARDDVLKGYLSDLDELASKVITETNRIHATGQGLARLNQVSSTVGVTNPAYTLDDPTGALPGEVNAGTLRINMYDAGGEVVDSYDIDVDPSTDSLNSMIQKISSADGDPGGGTIQATLTGDNQIRITAESGYTFAFEEDTSGFLVASGINGFFKGTGAGDIDVASLVKNNISYISTNSAGSVGDNSKALEIANLQFKEVFEDTGISIGEFYSFFAGKIGSDKYKVDVFVSTKQQSVSSFEMKLEEVRGVSMDEELTNLMRFQKSYEASARFVTVVDEMIDRLINGMGLVGR